ncbi:hypothetical protein BC830DRAFT_342902 [Chytriomyces sp. MP71]|nr:hypothetical protein BC830DRAFT_342902 [Chytriomyces sp. MP71]
MGKSLPLNQLRDNNDDVQPVAPALRNPAYPPIYLSRRYAHRGRIATLLRHKRRELVKRVAVKRPFHVGAEKETDAVTTVDASQGVERVLATVGPTTSYDDGSWNPNKYPGDDGTWNATKYHDPTSATSTDTCTDAAVAILAATVTPIASFDDGTWNPSKYPGDDGSWNPTKYPGNDGTWNAAKYDSPPESTTTYQNAESAAATPISTAAYDDGNGNPTKYPGAYDPNGNVRHAGDDGSWNQNRLASSPTSIGTTSTESIQPSAVTRTCTEHLIPA